MAKIKGAAGDRLYKEAEFLFQDISGILEDDLYKAFMERLERADYPTDQKKGIREMVIKAIVGTVK